MWERCAFFTPEKKRGTECVLRVTRSDFRYEILLDEFGMKPHPNSSRRHSRCYLFLRAPTYTLEQSRKYVQSDLIYFQFSMEKNLCSATKPVLFRHLPLKMTRITAEIGNRLSQQAKYTRVKCEAFRPHNNNDNNYNLFWLEKQKRSI